MGMEFIPPPHGFSRNHITELQGRYCIGMQPESRNLSGSFYRYQKYTSGRIGTVTGTSFNAVNVSYLNYI